MKKVELLAPAGNYEAMLGAFKAGADAVYLGGNAFGARAYADNFTEEEIIQGIWLAHMQGKKIYLTVNTLVKEKEISTLHDFLMPYYQNGLDGVIVQDVGVVRYIKEHFPNMELHVSTQMTITGSDGARLLKEEGAVRIVPARELSLDEIKEIKEKVDIEIETFIHGAMCYCYSGQCLFSSILGGRSGNRGRCAQPCRLPYQVEGRKEQYPLSMKDMCTLSLIPELIEAGIDSFKIEGRMKRPEYAAGVTALYRKYIDLYYRNPKAFTVDEKDLEYLRKLYIRSDISEGYYHQHNGKDMITPGSPAYAGSDDELLADIRKKYLSDKMELPVCMSAVLLKNQPASMTLTYDDISVTVHGDIVQEALKQPLSEEKIKAQLSKSGNTDFAVNELYLTMDEDIFMPVSALNQLRRDAFEVLTKAMKACDQRSVDKKTQTDEKTSGTQMPHDDADCNKVTQIHVLVGNKEQLIAAAKASAERIYVEGYMVNEELLASLSELKAHFEGEFYLAFPHVIRKNNKKFTEMLCDMLQTPVFSGALVRSLETYSYLMQIRCNKPVVTDCNLYACNKNAITFYRQFVKECYLPVELNKHEWKSLAEKDGGLSVVVYGRLPMMVTANCLKKSTDCCDKKAGYVTLTDRYRKEFPVYTNCRNCYNVIYNSVPLSLHKLFADKDGFNRFFACRLDFTTENSTETTQIIQYFQRLLQKYEEPFYSEFTTGHWKRGVE